MALEPREMTIKIDTGNPVSLTNLADKLTAAQRVLWNIGSSIHGSGGRRGGWSANVLEACTLNFVKSKPGCLEVATKLPDIRQTYIPGIELGESALACMSETLQALGMKDSNKLKKLFPDYGQRARVMNSVTPLFPEEEAQYDVVVTTKDFSSRLNAAGRMNVISLIKEEPVEVLEETTTTLTGKLYLIEVETGKRQIGVIVDNRQIPCYYPSEYEDMIRDLVPGTLVEVDGSALLNDNGTVRQLAEVFDIRMVQLIPLIWTRVDYGDRRFKLKEPIHIVQSFNEGIWTHECDQFGILEYGESRHESINAFRMDFAATWDLIAKEDDENLTSEARELKKKFLNLVDKVEDLP